MRWLVNIVVWHFETAHFTCLVGGLAILLIVYGWMGFLNKHLQLY